MVPATNPISYKNPSKPETGLREVNLDPLGIQIERRSLIVDQNPPPVLWLTNMFVSTSYDYHVAANEECAQAEAT